MDYFKCSHKPHREYTFGEFDAITKNNYNQNVYLLMRKVHNKGIYDK